MNYVFESLVAAGVKNNLTHPQERRCNSSKGRGTITNFARELYHTAAPSFVPTGSYSCGEILLQMEYRTPEKIQLSHKDSSRKEGEFKCILAQPPW